MSKPRKAFSYLKDQEIDRDMKTIYDWVSRIEYTEDNPDGSRAGKYPGEIILLKSGGNFYLEVCTASGSTVWKGVLLSDTP